MKKLGALTLILGLFILYMGFDPGENYVSMLWKGHMFFCESAHADRTTFITRCFSHLCPLQNRALAPVVGNAPLFSSLRICTG